MSEIGLLVGAYLLGSVSFAYLIVRVKVGVDIRRIGSGNAGATNVLRAAGPVPAAAALLLDVAKGAVPVVLAHRWQLTPLLVGAVGFAAVVGHIFPVFLGFRGGKGVATAAGAMGGLAPVPTALSAAVFVVVVVWKRYVSLGSIVALGTFPLWVHLCGRAGWAPSSDPWFVFGSALVPALVVAMHAANIRRLVAGTEPKLGERAP